MRAVQLGYIGLLRDLRIDEAVTAWFYKAVNQAREGIVSDRITPA